jgi:hypothetical protein
VDAGSVDISGRTGRRPAGAGILERDPDQSLLKLTRDGEPPPWWVEFCEYPSESSFSAPLTNTAGMALNNGWFEPAAIAPYSSGSLSASSNDAPRLSRTMTGG